MKTVCNAICKKIEQVLNAYELICLHQQSHDANVFASSKNSIKNSTSPLDENRKQSEKEKSRIEKNITKIELSKSYGKTDLSSPSSNFDLTCYDVEELERMVQELTSENRKLKELSEIQNIEFAQNITQLNESLSELQEERNNLSLVLQSIEIQAQEINPVTAEKTIVERNKVDGAYLTEQNKETECKLNIMELNYKVKTEITALSSQTEMINRELCALREQFNFAKIAYSEKVLQLNSKLMRRTEILLNVKEDLDASVQNAEDLKCLLEYVKGQLSEKEELLKISEEKGKDLENKFKAMKEKFVKKELSLKQSHNSQLSELKDQTKASIDKLNIEIQNLNDKLQKCETVHAIKFSNMEEHYNEELHNLVGDKKMLVECEAILNKIFDNSESFKAGFLNNLNQLDVYNSRICKLNSNLSHIQSKLQEKEKLIKDQQYKIDDLQNQVQFLNKENKDFNDLKNNMNEISNLYEAATSSLERETKLRETYENDLSTLKEKYELVIKDLENVCSLQVENEKLKMLLQESVDELKILNTKYIENDCTLDKTTNELKDCKHQISVLEEIQTKYVSLLNDFECVNENLEKEKCAALKASNDVSKWRTSYDIMLLSFNKFFDESYQNMEKINLKLNEKDLKFKVLESQFSKISNVCKSQIPILRTEIINLREINEILLQKVENRDDLANAESKIEILEEELKAVVKEKRALKSDLEIQLAEAESKLKVALEKIELGSCELNEVRNNLSSSVVKLEDAERKLKEESEKLSVTEKIAFDWEEKYNASVTKVECLEQEIKDLIMVKDALKSELETQLAKSELELKTALVKMELYNNNFNEIQNKLTDSFTKLESTESELKIKAEKLLVIERTSVEWENKYNAAMLHLKEMSTTLKDTEDKLAFSLKQMEEKNAEMALLIPKEKFEYYEKDYIKKLEALKSEIKDLKENITTFSTKMMEKELEIKNIQTEKENLSIQHNESLKGLKDKLEDAEKNYATQMDEMKSLILQHNEDKCTLKTENLELIKAQEKLKEELSAIKSESKLKEDELSRIQQKYEINNKEQIAKIHSFQETMKDKENMVLKLKASIESIKKENSDKVEELKKKIIKLEEEREHLMIQAQERVSNTEAKCREDIKALQEKNNKLLIEKNNKLLI
ncbi:hypothetical protein CEXT_206451 [Caerostris extrusa]|uniref:Uncharacterized protein n=1 Tax=Caerostris extrusa TaxID=172846 RepID=A0AAV4SWH5_CAEEX|nr:hypothetical protein CEXT_206451 [Caerostris extrusa]